MEGRAGAIQECVLYYKAAKSSRPAPTFLFWRSWIYVALYGYLVISDYSLSVLSYVLEYLYLGSFSL